MDFPAPVGRVYRMQLWLLAFALVFVAFGSFFVLTSFRDLVYGELEWKPGHLLVGTIFFLVGLFLTLRFYSSRVACPVDGIEKRNIFNSRRLPYSAMRGRREYLLESTEGGGTRYLRLESNDDQFPKLDFMKAYNFDDAFFRWFNQLPNLDEEDKTRPKTSNFGLV